MPPEPTSNDTRPGNRKRVGLYVGLFIGGCVLFFGLVVGMYFWMRAVTEDKTRRNNAKIVSLCLQNYDSAHGTPPGPSIDSKTQNPSRQLNLFGNAGDPVIPPANPSDRISWRAVLLPYMERQDVYVGLDFNKPWNDPANQPAASLPLRAFGDPLDPLDANTRLRCFYNNGALFDSDPKKRIGLEQVPDGSSYTLLFAESGERVPWAQFNELEYRPAATLPALGHPNRTTFLAAMADGSVRVVKKSVSPATLNAAITRAGNDTPGADW